jgi:hypothetical protein
MIQEENPQADKVEYKIDTIAHPDSLFVSIAESKHCSVFITNLAKIFGFFKPCMADFAFT